MDFSFAGHDFLTFGFQKNQPVTFGASQIACHCFTNLCSPSQMASNLALNQQAHEDR
jgi:hypothetical protein